MNFGGAFPGMPGTGSSGGAGGNPNGMSDQEMMMIKYMQMGMESCPIKAGMSGVMGGVLGGAFGLFMASMRYDTPLSSPLNPANPTNMAAAAANASASSASASATPHPASTSTAAATAPATTIAPATAIPGTPGTTTVADLPLRRQLSIGLRDLGRSSLSSAKNFGFIGAVYSGTECCIEGLRAKNDLRNAVYAGFITGALLARRGGPMAAGLSGGGFAVFSLGIEWYMRQPSDD